MSPTGTSGFWTGIEDCSQINTPTAKAVCYDGTEPPAGSDCPSPPPGSEWDVMACDQPGSSLKESIGVTLRSLRSWLWDGPINFNAAAVAESVGFANAAIDSIHGRYCSMEDELKAFGKAAAAAAGQAYLGGQAPPMWLVAGQDWTTFDDGMPNFFPDYGSYAASGAEPSTITAGQHDNAIGAKGEGGTPSLP